MKKLTIFTVLFFVLCLQFVIPRIVTQEEVEKVAYGFVFKEIQFIDLRMTKEIYSVGSIEPILLEKTKIGYVVHLEPKGYVIVPDFTELSPFKFISYAGDYEKSKNHPFVKKVLNEILHEKKQLNYSEGLSSIQSDYSKNSSLIIDQINKNERVWNIYLSEDILDSGISRFSSEGTVTVGPLLSSKWGQEDPFNLYTPVVCDEKTKTGCPATALTQIMYFWKYPQSGIGSHSYSYFYHSSGPIDPGYFSSDPFESEDCDQEVNLEANFNHEYYWDLMCNSYSGNESEAQKDAVARLMSDVGIAIETKYTPKGSGITLSQSPNITSALVNYFKYDNDVELKERIDCSPGETGWTEWFEMFKIQIDNGWPAFLGTCQDVDPPNIPAGHAIVVDGYQIIDGINKVHVNLGWEGNQDNYYAIDNISSYGFGNEETDQAVINIHPPLVTPSITVITPNGGENWEQWSLKDITWTSANVSGNVEIRLVYKATGEEYMIEENTENDGIYEWEVGMCTHISTSQLSIPQGMIHTGKYKVKILSVNDPDINDSSNDYFSIVEPSPTPSITVTSPNGGENCPLGFTYNITWNAQDLSNNVKITLWKDGTLLGIIADNLDPYASPYAWTVGQYNGGTASAGTGYTIKIKEKNTTVADTSDASFSIVVPSITVTSPNGGESWQIGSTRNITWNSQGIAGNLTISLWQNGSRLGTIKNNIDPGDGTYAWIVGQYDGVTALEGTGYEIIIRDSVTSIYDFCDAPFTLTLPDEVTYTLYPTTVPNVADWTQESNIIGEYDGNKAEGTPTGTTYLCVTNFDNWTLPAGKVITKVEYGILARFTDGVKGKARMKEVTHGETARWITFGTNWYWRDFDITSLEVSWTKAEVDALQVAVKRAYADDPADANLRVGGIRLKVTVE